MHIPTVLGKYNFRIQHFNSSLLKYFHVSASQEPAAEEAEEEAVTKISETFFYDYSELASMPFVTPDSNIPLDFLTLVYPLALHKYNLGILAS
jgi:hypothetical protein